jgi:hypothetical protein
VTDNDKALVERLRVVALQVSKRDAATTTTSVIQSWGLFCSDEEAIGAAIMKMDDLKPGFSVDQYLVCSPDSDIIEAQAARLAEADALIDLQNQDIGRLREALRDILRGEDPAIPGAIEHIARAALGETE